MINNRYASSADDHSKIISTALVCAIEQDEQLGKSAVEMAIKTGASDWLATRPIMKTRAHQHLDVGHFQIYKYEELAGDGGHYDSFGSSHDVNYAVITNGKGRLFIQTLLPSNPQIRLVQGPQLYSYGGKTYPPAQDTGPAPECRIEISPGQNQAADYFLNVLTATDANIGSVEQATAAVNDQEVTVTIGMTTITFTKDAVGGQITGQGHRTELPDRIISDSKG